MFDYKNFADIVGSSVKSFWGPLFPEAVQRNTFESLVDAKVSLNKAIYSAATDFSNKISEITKPTM